MKYRFTKQGISLVLTMLLTFMAMMPGIAAEPSGPDQAQQSFKDLPADHWAAGSIVRWANDGVIRGYPDGTIQPEQAVTRAEFAVIVNSVFGFPPAARSVADAPSDVWFAEDISKAVTAGYLELDADGNANPNAPLSRADAALGLDILFGFSRTHEGPASAFTDVGDLRADVARAVDALAAAGYLKGYADRTFQPDRTMTRAELLSLLDRLAAALGDEAGGLSGTTIAGNVIVRTAGVTLRDVVVEGNLYLTAGIGDGDAMLDHVTVKGTTFIRGGGEHSVGIADSALNDVEINKDDNKIRVYATGSTHIDHVRFLSGGKLESGDAADDSFQSVSIPNGASDVELIGHFNQVVVPPSDAGSPQRTVTITGTVEELHLQSGVKILLAEGAVVKKLIVDENAAEATIEGDGKIETIDNSADGLTVNGHQVPTGTTDGSDFSGSAGETGSTGGTGSTGSTGSSGDNPMWTLTFGNEFDSADDLDDWTAEIGTGQGGWGNNEQEYYTAENATVEDGNLVITAKKEDVESSHYTSARLVTRDTFSQAYGKFEARIKLPTGTGFWPAFWMMPQDSVYGTWASSGEIDIMENRGRIPETVSGAIHFGGEFPDNVSLGQAYTFPDGGAADDYHTYTLEWEPGELRWYVDGHLYQTQNNWYSIGKNQPANNAYPVPFDQPFYMILNLALGGNFDGGNNIDDSKLPGKMYVDYVRAYKLTGRPYREATPPVVVKEAVPDEAQAPLPDGNLLYNSGYDQDSVDVANLSYTNGGGPAVEVPDTDYWSLFEGAEGAGSVSVEPLDGKNYARIDIANAGTQSYSVQLLNTASIVKGHFYRVSFDAKSDTNRTMMVRMTGGASRGYAAYSQASTVRLTDQLEHYEFEYQMWQDTDLMARTEFNIGLNNHPVWIGNVRVEEIDNIVTDDDMPKTPLDGDGNRVYNGSFDQGRVDRMTFWHVTTGDGASATAAVDPISRYLDVNVTNAGGGASGVQVLQKGILLESGMEYQLAFNAAAQSTRDIEVELTNADGSKTYAAQTFTLDASDVHDAGAVKTFDFKMDDATDEQAQLVFRVGGAVGHVLLDHVTLIQTTIVYGPDTVFYPLVNGNFDTTLVPWSGIAVDGGLSTASWEAGEAKLSIDALGNFPWSNMLIQQPMKLTKGATYELSFDAYATVERKMEVDVEMTDAPYSRSFDETVDLDTASKHFAFTFKMGSDIVGGLKFFLGNIPGQSVAEPHAVYLDNVVFQIKDAPTPSPVFQADAFDNVLGQPIDLSFADDEAWRNSVTSVSVNGAALTEDRYALTAGTLHLNADVFPTSAIYTIKVDAAGYAAALTKRIVMPADGDKVRNGAFSDGIANWSVWSASGDSTVAVQGGAATISIHSIGDADWSTQFFETDIPLQAGKQYELSFDASATVDRPISIEFTNTAISPIKNSFLLTSAPQTFTKSFSTSNDELLKLNFLIGNAVVDGAVTPADPHTITLDNISIRELSAPPVGHALANGTFDADISGWDTYLADGSDATVTYDTYGGEGVMKVDFVSYDGNETWSTQVYQGGLQLDAGKTYELSMDAWSTAAKDIMVSVEQEGTPPTPHYLEAQTAALSATRQTWTYTFTMASTVPNGKLVLQLGGGHHTDPLSVYFDNVSLTAVGGD